MTAAEELEACLRALNSLYIRGHEKRAGVSWIAGKPERVSRLLAHTTALIQQRAADPNSLENWGNRAATIRASEATASDYVSEPSHFNAYDLPSNYTTR